MALTSSNVSDEPRAFSVGPLKIQVLNFATETGDSAGTVTADSMEEVFAAHVSGGMVLNAATTYSGNQATFSFFALGADTNGTIILFGK